MIHPVYIKIVDQKNLEADFAVQWGSPTPGTIVGVERSFKPGTTEPIMVLTIRTGEQ